MKNACPCSRGHQGAKLGQARQPEFCSAQPMFLFQMQKGDIMAFGTSSCTDRSICKMGLKNSCMHILIVAVFDFKPRSPKSLTPRTPAAPFTLLPPSHSDLSSQVYLLYFTPQISRPTRPSLPGTYLVLAIQVPRSGKPLNPRQTWTVGHTAGSFLSQPPELQDTPLSLTSASVSLVSCHQPPFQSLGLTAQHLNCHGS